MWSQSVANDTAGFGALPLYEVGNEGEGQERQGDVGRAGRCGGPWSRWGGLCVAAVLCASLCAGGFYVSFAVPGGDGSEPGAKFANLKALSNLDVFGESDDALPEEDFPPFDVPASLEPEFWKVQKEQIKREQYDPTACFGKLSFASAWTASLGLKIRAAMQECNKRNYRADPTPFRRLHEVHTIPALPQEQASIVYPPSAWAEYMEKSKPATPRGLQDLDGPDAEAAYNMTGGKLSLKTLFAFGEHWTVEGWHYMKEHHPGCIWDTRRREGAPGLRACFSGGRFAIDIFAEDSLTEPVRVIVADVAAPLSKWVHLAVQRRGQNLEFFIDGTLSGNTTVPGQLKDELLSQSRITLGGDEAHRYRGMLSNMRLTTDAVYKLHFEPDPNLEQLMKTRFLLKGHFIDVVTHQQMDRIGDVTTKYTPDILMDTWKAQGLLDDDHNFTPPVNMSRVEVLRRLFPFEDDLYKTEFLGAFCTRVILQILKEITTIEDRLMDAVPLCDETATSPQCYKAVSYAFRQAVSVGRYGAELQPRCLQTVNEDFRGDFRCSERLEGLSWALDGFASQIAKAHRICHDGNLKSPLLDLGACVGESLSATGYMFASALLLESALGFDCPNDLADPPRPVTETIQLTCARDSTAIFRTTFLAASKAARAAGHCGGTDTLCGRSILRSAAAISGIGETGVFLRVFCHGPTRCCKFNRDTNKTECDCSKKAIIRNKRRDKSDQQQCARFSGSTVKLAGSAALAATEAEGECKFSKTAKSACQTMPGAALAGLGFFIENVARITRDCPPKPIPLDKEEIKNNLILGPANPTQFYQCGQNTKRLGVSLDVISRGIAGAVVNCPYGTELERVTKPVKSPRRFFTP